jgi:ATP-binding cassette subfamily B protein
LIEVTLVLSILAIRFDAWFAWITLAALALYIYFTVRITEWRTQFRREANEFDSAAHTRAIDSLLNYETVKYFGNEAYEAKRYDDTLERLRLARLKAQTTLSVLNTGQQLIIAVALVGMLWRATQGVVEGRMTLGDLVMINAFMIQLYIPLNFLGVLYREIKQSLTDLDKMFTLMDREREVADQPGALPLQLGQAPALRFESVSFAYEPDRPILHDISFEIPAGKTVAVVGPSGSGKSTLARLVMALEKPTQGKVLFKGQDLHALPANKLREARSDFQMVFQDPYGSLDPRQTILRIVSEPLHSTLHSASGQSLSALDLKDRATSALSEVGLRASDLNKYPHEFSGGQRQRIAIARALITRPSLIVADEPVSALDVSVQAQVLNLLMDLQDRFGLSYLFVSHDLAVVNLMCDDVMVLQHGQVVEAGTAKEIFQNAQHAYTQTLLAAIPGYSK